eukprot:scaffold245022_cov32-Tisochrysis_lutea.AAC.2
MSHALNKDGRGTLPRLAAKASRAARACNQGTSRRRWLHALVEHQVLGGPVHVAQCAHVRSSRTRSLPRSPPVVRRPAIREHSSRADCPPQALRVPSAPSAPPGQEYVRLQLQLRGRAAWTPGLVKRRCRYCALKMPAR